MRLLLDEGHLELRDLVLDLRDELAGVRYGLEHEEDLLVVLRVVVHVAHRDLGEDAQGLVDRDLGPRSTLWVVLLEDDGVDEDIAGEDDEEAEDPEQDEALLEQGQ